MLVALLPEFRGSGRIGKQKADLVSRTLDGVGEHACVLVNDLKGNPPDRGCDHRLSFPETFGNSQTKTLSQTF